MKALNHCRKYHNKYLFQSKNPWRFNDFRSDFPLNVVLGTTIETNRNYPQTASAPTSNTRASAMNFLAQSFETTVTIEPIMDFDSNHLFDLICRCNPSWVNIGADSKGHNLPEPDSNKIISLIWALRGESVKIKLKPNLKRLIKDKDFLAREFPG